MISLCGCHTIACCPFSCPFTWTIGVSFNSCGKSHFPKTIETELLACGGEKGRLTWTLQQEWHQGRGLSQSTSAGSPTLRARPLTGVCPSLGLSPPGGDVECIRRWWTTDDSERPSLYDLVLSVMVSVALSALSRGELPDVGGPEYTFERIIEALRVVSVCMALDLVGYASCITRSPIWTSPRLLT